MTEPIDDPVGQLRRSVTAVEALIQQIRPEQWTARTPCDDWDVRRVVEHLVGMNLVFAAMLSGRPHGPRGEDLPCETLPQAFHDSAATLLDAFSQPGVLDRSYSGPLGSATGSDRLKIRLYDLLAHGWDLAVATEQNPQLPDDAAQDALAFAREQLSEAARPGRFGPPQVVPDDAPAIDRLAAFLGRRSRLA
jgi:uncharacterized protein (TIGR03086 family)